MTNKDLNLTKDELAAFNSLQKVCSSLFSTRNKNKNNNNKIDEVSKLIETELLPLAINLIPPEEKERTLLSLNEIRKKLQLIKQLQNSELNDKQMVVVAGGFSAGKSQFINSLFKEDSVHLPIGIQPTTSIPTYVTNNSNNIEINAFSHQGTKVNLLDIAPDFYHQISHEFTKKLGINLKGLIQKIFISAPINFEYLCFVDTPGYDPANTQIGSTDHDKEISQDMSNKAEALLWLIGLDTNGTISQTDLEFLSKVLVKDNNKKIYIVLNKADLRPQTIIQEVLDEISDTLTDYGIKISGISAYSSTLKTEIKYKRMSLFTFLKQMDAREVKKDNRMDLLIELLKIGLKLQPSMLNQIKKCIDEYNKLNYLLKHIQKPNHRENLLEVENYIKKEIENKLSHLTHLRKVMVQLERTINDVFNQVGAPSIMYENFPEVTLEEITEKNASKSAKKDLRIAGVPNHFENLFKNLFNLGY